MRGNVVSVQDAAMVEYALLLVAVLLLAADAYQGISPTLTQHLTPIISTLSAGYNAAG